MYWWDTISNTLRAGISPQTAVYALAAVGLNLHFGYTGLLNFGQVGFAAAGAYGAGIAIKTGGFPLPLAIFVGILAGVVLALLLGAPTLRLRADYLAIVTIAVGEILRLIVKSRRLANWTGGASGINPLSKAYEDANFIWEPGRQYGVKVLDRVNLRFSGADLWNMLVGWTVVVLCVGVMWLAVSSPWGRVLRSIREDEDAARALGKNVFRFKMQSLVFGGVFGSIAGIFLALHRNTVQPDNYRPTFTFFALAAAIIGGLGRVWGPVVGAIIFWVLVSVTEEVLRDLVNAGHMPEWLMDGVQVGQVRFILTGAGLMALMVFRPQGVFGDKREIAIDVRR